MKYILSNDRMTYLLLFIQADFFRNELLFIQIRSYVIVSSYSAISIAAFDWIYCIRMQYSQEFTLKWLKIDLKCKTNQKYLFELLNFGIHLNTARKSTKFEVQFTNNNNNDKSSTRNEMGISFEWNNFERRQMYFVHSNIHISINLECN